MFLFLLRLFSFFVVASVGVPLLVVPLLSGVPSEIITL